MKKIFLFTITILLTTTVFAATKSKYVIAVESFSYTNQCSEAFAEQVRNNVIGGISEFPYIQVIDAQTAGALSAEDQRRSSEAAMADPTARMGEMKQLGAEYILIGSITSYSCVFQPQKDDPNKGNWKATMVLALKLVNTEDGTTQVVNYPYDGSRHFGDVRYGLSEDKERSISSLFAFVKKDMKIFVTDKLKQEGTLVDTDYTMDKKKKKVETCYITLGSADGLKKDIKFEVFKVKVIAGTNTYQQIEDVVLEVEEVVAEHLALCKVKKGEKLLTALKEYEQIKDADPQHAEPLIVRTRKVKDDGGWGTSFTH
ncbi:MAG: hypothetical protein IJS73_04775 [Paludibacteraceae bacterium]|nr:hypothetical protein [Paludibacteraceae bacterium]